MKWERLVVVAYNSITKNRMRSFLTMLGMIIGVGSVIAMLALGSGTQKDIENEIASLGTNLIMIVPGNSSMGGISRGAGSLNTLSLKDVERLSKEASLLTRVSPLVRSSGQIIAGSNNWSTTAEGVDVNYLDIKNMSLRSGAFFTDRDVKTKAKVAVIGRTVADELFGDNNPIGAKVRIGNVPFTVIGVLEEKGQSMMGNDQDDIVLAPYTTVLYRLGDGETIHMIMASALSDENIEETEAEISGILRSEHRLSDGEEDDFSVRSQTEITERATSVTGMLTLLLGAVAGVSLLVGGIGIMNIMLVSVTERTREIGIRLAIGAREKDVLVQFLVEAAIISLLGGIVGIAAGVGIALLIGGLIGSSILISPVVVAVSFVFSGAIGIFFGFYPARKAASMDPIVALHYE